MVIERLTSSLLNGKHLHCRPVKGGPIVEATIVPSDIESTPTFRVAIICPARMPASKCALRDRPGVRGPRRCLWYRGDSRGVYQIIGLNMDKKLELGTYYLNATGFVERIAPKVVSGEAAEYSSGVTS